MGWRGGLTNPIEEGRGRRNRRRQEIVFIWKRQGEGNERDEERVEEFKKEERVGFNVEKKRRKEREG